MKAGWARRPLGELCRIEIGGTPSRGQSKFWDEKKTTGNVWLSIADMPKTLHASISSSAEHLSDEGAKRVKVVKAGTLLVSFKLTLGRLAYADIDLRTNEAIAALELVDEKSLNKEYLYWFLTFFDWQKAAEGEDKVKGKTLNKAKLAVLPVLVPPLLEQQCIVGILDETFADMATAMANAEKNLKNARELFESYLNSALSSLNVGWTDCSLGECVDFVTYGFTNPMPSTETGPWMITAKNVIGGKIDYASARHTSREAFDELLTNKSRPKIGDVLLTKDGTLGRLAVVDRDQICINQSVALLRPNGRMIAHLMKYLLSSRDYQRRMIGEADGATIKHIYITRVSKMDVAFPASLSAQRELVAKLDVLSDGARALEGAYLRKLDTLRHLKQSILQKAFSGELTSPPSQAIKEAAE